jgi:hypothetical protein
MQRTDKSTGFPLKLNGFLEMVPDAIARIIRRCPIRPKQQRHKLIPTQAHHQIITSDGSLDAACHMAQNYISRLMTIVIINGLKSIEVEINQRNEPMVLDSKILKKHQIAIHPVHRLNALAPGVFRRCQLRSAAPPAIKVAIVGIPIRIALMNISLRLMISKVFPLSHRKRNSA